MKIVKPSYEIIDMPDYEKMVKKIERIGRICYQSDGKSDGTLECAEKFVIGLISRGHEAMLEHESMSVLFVVDRGVTHELVRHRIASFAQESTRYCNYGKDGEVTFILPCFFDTGMGEASNSSVFDEWKFSCRQSESTYLNLLEYGATPQQARTVLNNSTKSQIVVTANMREWRHIFALRALGMTGAPHPQMLEVMVPLFLEVKRALPAMFCGMQLDEDY